MGKPSGSVFAGSGLDALLINRPTSIIALPMPTLSGPPIAPAESTNQPDDPAALALSVNVPKPVCATSASNFSLKLAPLSPAAWPDVPLKVWVNWPPYILPPRDDAVVQPISVGLSLMIRPI